VAKKTKIDMHLPPGQAKKVADGLDAVESHVVRCEADWPRINPTQRQALLAVCPLFARFIALCERFR